MDRWVRHRDNPFWAHLFDPQPHLDVTPRLLDDPGAFGKHSFVLTSVHTERVKV